MLSFALGRSSLMLSRTRPCLSMRHLQRNNTRHRTLLSSARFLSATKQPLKQPEPYSTVYFFPKLKLIRLISRMKIYQTAWTVVLLAPLGTMYLQGDVELQLLQLVGSASTFACVMLYILGSFVSRTIGLISLSDDQRTVRMSHLDFWGHRKDVFVDVKNVVPLSELPENPLAAPYVKLQRYDEKGFLICSLRFGKVKDLEKFEIIFGKLENKK